MVNEQVQDEWVDFQVVQPGSTETEVDEWAAFEPISEGNAVTSTDVAQQGLIGGAIEAAPVMPGTIAGAKGGAAIGTMIAPGPGTAVGGVIGGLAGMVGGALIGGELREYAAEEGVTFASIEDLPPEQRPLGVGAETVGGTLTGGLSVMGLARTGYRTLGTSVVGRWVNQILNTAKAKPLAFAMAETSSAVSAGVAGGIAEHVDPGDRLTRFGAEATAGMFNPTRHAVTSVQKFWDWGKSNIQRLSPAARETAAGRVLNDLLQQRGEDPKLLAQMLELYDPDVTTNVAQITGSKTLGALQMQLTKHSAQFGQESQEQADSAMKVLVGMVDELRRTGDPEALVQAAEIKHDIFTSVLAGRIQKAEGDAFDLARAITNDTPAARSELGKQARGLIGDALKQSRQAERELWELVPDSPATIDNLKVTFQREFDRLLPEVRDEKMPKVVTDFIKRVEKEGATSNDLTQLRSELLEKSREFSDEGKHGLARIYGSLAESTLDDLDAAFTGNDAYDSARAFSKALNDQFTRTFVGQATATGRYGAKVPPELLMVKAMASGPEARALQMQELEEATRFLVKQNVTDDMTAINTMMDVQERMLRLAAAESVDSLKGTVNPKKLTDFMNSNEALLNRFPEVKQQLQEAVDSELVRQSLVTLQKNSTKVFETTSAYSQLLKGKNPVNLAGKALDSNSPEREFKQLITVATKAGDKGKAGLRTSVLDAAMRKATRGKNLDFDEFGKLLFESKVTGQRSSMDVLKNAGIFTDEHISNIKKVIDMADKIQTAQKPGTAIDDIDEGLDVIMDLITRAGGATLATKAAGITGQKAAGHGLIIAAGGSRAARSLLENIPDMRVKGVLMDAMTNPALMKKLLEKAPTPETQIEKVRYLHAYLLQSGIFNTIDATQGEQPVDISEAMMSTL